MTLLEELGGAGRGIAGAAWVMQAIVESGAGLTGAATIHSYVFAPNPIVMHGTPEQKQRMPGPLTRGEERACFGISEPNSGLDTTRVSMRATWDGTTYIAPCPKAWPTMASPAERIMLFARTTPIAQCTRPVDGKTPFSARPAHRLAPT